MQASSHCWNKIPCSLRQLSRETKCFLNGPSRTARPKVGAPWPPCCRAHNGWESPPLLCAQRGVRVLQRWASTPLSEVMNQKCLRMTKRPCPARPASCSASEKRGLGLFSCQHCSEPGLWGGSGGTSALLGSLLNHTHVLSGASSGSAFPLLCRGLAGGHQPHQPCSSGTPGGGGGWCDLYLLFSFVLCSN